MDFFKSAADYALVLNSKLYFMMCLYVTVYVLYTVHFTAPYESSLLSRVPIHFPYHPNTTLTLLVTPKIEYGIRN